LGIARRKPAKIKLKERLSAEPVQWFERTHSRKGLFRSSIDSVKESCGMTKIVRSALVERPATALFDLVDAVEQYPKFLPWCVGSSVAERSANHTLATIVIGLPGLQTAFTTRNTNTRRPPPDICEIRLALVDGPFSAMSGHWKFSPLMGGATDGGQSKDGAPELGCKVELALEYTFKSPHLEKVVGRLFDEVAQTMVDRFVAEALKKPALKTA
jgi:ribosome-associated toxin RatA of RatAB toxin-antitoxin module